MAQYRAIIQGNRGNVSRLGSKKSGISAEINGWNKGVFVFGRFNKETGKDEFIVEETGGSMGSAPKKIIKIIK